MDNVLRLLSIARVRVWSNMIGSSQRGLHVPAVAHVPYALRDVSFAMDHVPRAAVHVIRIYGLSNSPGWPQDMFFGPQKVFWSDDQVQRTVDQHMWSTWCLGALRAMQWLSNPPAGTSKPQRNRLNDQRIKRSSERFFMSAEGSKMHNRAARLFNHSKATRSRSLWTIVQNEIGAVKTTS